MKTLSIKNENGLSGSYVIKTWDASKVKDFKDTLCSEPLSVSKRMKNKIVSTSGYGRNLIMRQLAGDTTYSIEIDSAKIGTGTNAPADSDTDLQTAVLSNIPVANVVVSNDSVLITFFITDALLTNGTYKEFGIYCNGRLFARSLISPNFTKGSNQNATVDYTITSSST